MWKWWKFCYILLHLCVGVWGQKTGLDTPFNMRFLRAFRNWSFNTFGKTGTEKRFLQIAKEANTMQETVPDHIPFPCNVTGGRSPEVPISVHKLRPGDIDIIAAMGDSLTAGAGALASNVLQVLVENRGISATGGGQGTWRQYLTLPNIIKEFNPNLIGYALGDSLVTHEASQLNVAETGAMSEDMPYMAEILVKRIKRDSRIDLQKHWKFISLMVGSNDFCVDLCWNPSPWSALEKHKADLLQVLRTLRDNLPRTFVALIPPPHLSLLVKAVTDSKSLRCSIITDFECPCLFGLAYQKSIPLYYEIMRQWQHLDMKIAALPEFQRDDFAVVAQPILMDVFIPLANGYTDMTYLSSDCFHVSQKTDAMYANGIWNNLLEPVGSKKTKWSNLFKFFHCPTSERPYLTTMLNSKQ